MIAVKLKNVSVKYGKSFRNNQNYTMAFHLGDIEEASITVNEIKKMIEDDYSHKVILSNNSHIEIVNK